MKIKVMAIDDEPDALSLITELAIKNQVVDSVEPILNDGRRDILELIVVNEPDLLLLDIKMPGISGIEIAKHLKNFSISPYIVFTSAFEQYAIEAIKQSAYDFLLKPIKPDSLNEVLLRVASQVAANIQHAYLENIPNKVKINTRTGTLFLKPSDIVYLEADGNYTTICMRNGNKETSAYNLGKMEKALLQNCFFRISRSVIINTEYLIKTERTKPKCYLAWDGKEVSFASTAKHIKSLEDYLGD